MMSHPVNLLHKVEDIESWTEMVMVEPTAAVLRRAAQPLPTPLGTPDAIHLSTALLWREVRGEELVMATHDQMLAIAARASGLPVIGV